MLVEDNEVSSSVLVCLRRDGRQEVVVVRSENHHLADFLIERIFKQKVRYVVLRLFAAGRSCL